MSELERNKNFIRRMLADLDKGLETGDYSFLDVYYSPDFKNILLPHQQNGGGREAGGLDEMRKALDGARAAFGERKHEVYLQIAEGDVVISELEVTLKHTGVFLGIPPTGKTVLTGQTIYHKLCDGKIIESWTDGDLLGLARKLGATLQVPGQG